MNPALRNIGRAIRGAYCHANTFEPDGCTMAPDFNFRCCCDDHDLAYYFGGTATDRKIADLQFRECIRERKGQIIAYIYYSAVRIFGARFWNTRSNKLTLPMDNTLEHHQLMRSVARRRNGVAE